MNGWLVQLYNGTQRGTSGDEGIKEYFGLMHGPETQCFRNTP